MVEWTQNNSTYNAPDVSGRVIFFDGKFSVSFHKRFDPEKYFPYAGFGDYKFENNKFAYRYTNSMALNGDESHQYIGDPNKSYGDGEYRWYEYELKADGLFMVSEDEKQEWNFLNTGDMIYIDLIDLSGLPITRTWKKFLNYLYNFLRYFDLLSLSNHIGVTSRGYIERYLKNKNKHLRCNIKCST